MSILTSREVQLWWILASEVAVLTSWGVERTQRGITKPTNCLPTLSTFRQCSFTCIHLPQLLKEKFVFLHIKPYNKDFSDHIQCSTSLKWQTVQCWDVGHNANVAASFHKGAFPESFKRHNKCSFSKMTNSLMQKSLHSRVLFNFSSFCHQVLWVVQTTPKRLDIPPPLETGTWIVLEIL